MNIFDIDIFNNIIKDKKNIIENKNIDNNLKKVYQELDMNRLKNINIDLLQDLNNKNDDELYEIVKYNNLKVLYLLNNIFSKNEYIKIIAKGPTAITLKNENIMAINQGIIFTNNKFLFLNDFPALFGIEDRIKNIKFIFFPDYPHFGYHTENGESKCAFPINKLNFKIVIDYLKKFNFNGEIFIYKIHSSLNKKYLNEFNFYSRTTTDIPIQLFSKYLLKNKFKTYGYDIGNGYHSELKNLNFIDISKVKNLLLNNIIDNLNHIYNENKLYYENKINYNIIENNNNENKKNKELKYLKIKHSIELN